MRKASPPATENRVVFCGTPEFAVPSLQALRAAGFEIALAVTQPDRPRGRGRKAAPPPVKEAARELGIPTEQPEKLAGAEELRERISALAPEFLAVVAFGMLIPRSFLDLPACGAVNVHASLLPRHRGAEPIIRSILAGDPITGVTTMMMEEGLDSGPALLVRRTEIGPRDNEGTLRLRLAELGAELLVETLRGLQRGEITPKPQIGDPGPYAAKVSKEETAIDWSRPAAELERMVRAFSPRYGAAAALPDGRRIKIYEAETAEGKGRPGELLSCSGKELVVAAGEGALRIRELQCEGKRRMEAQAFLCGADFCEGDTLT